ncbi:hypothetical protein LSM04_006532 [Trypanosoma melophagium]|uniref:uncharacterized protein n=1 Tax=Trypanosoma melophagium TaxID=715481 RepID=UPI00351AA2B3|nr:hypothetical protein LSM04_006532 [Trypanosoma melophagium]
MESEITIAQLRHCGVHIPIQTSLGEFTAVSLEKFPILLVEADTAARLRYLSILTKKLQEIGCAFIQDEHLMYPTESSTRKILMWLVTKFHGIATTQNNNDKKYKNSPIGEALFSFQSLVRNYNQCDESKNEEKGYIYPLMVVSTVRRPF